jgi:hypothetical protein
MMLLDDCHKLCHACCTVFRLDDGRSGIQLSMQHLQSNQHHCHKGGMVTQKLNEYLRTTREMWSLEITNGQKLIGFISSVTLM